MSETVTKVSKYTPLTWGQMHVDVALYKTTGDVKAAAFDTERLPEQETIPDTLAQLEASVAQAEAPGDPLTDVPDTHGMGEGSTTVTAPAPAPRPRKGIYREDETFLDLTEQLDRITEATQLEDFHIIGFVRRETVPRDRIIASYYLAAQDHVSAKVLRLLQLGMQRTERYAVAKWTKASRQAIGVVGPARSGSLTVLELVFQANVRAPNQRCLQFQQAQVSPEECKLATELVRSMAEGPELLRVLEDDAITMRAQLRAAAEEGLVDQWEAPTVPEPVSTQDVEAALRGSVG